MAAAPALAAVTAAVVPATAADAVSVIFLPALAASVAKPLPLAPRPVMGARASLSGADEAVTDEGEVALEGTPAIEAGVAAVAGSMPWEGTPEAALASMAR